MSGYSIDITLWGENYQIESAQLAKLRGSDTPPTLVIKGGRVTKFNRRTVGIISKTSIFITQVLNK